MPKYRNIHTKIVDSYDFNEMPDDFTRLFWILLTVSVDSEGRGVDNPAWLKSKLFPMREDVTSPQIEQAMAWLNERGMVVRYTSGGKRYFHLPTFKNYQAHLEREAKSSIPAPQPSTLTANGERPPVNQASENSGVTQELLASSSGVTQDKVESNSAPSVVVVVVEDVIESVIESELLASAGGDWKPEQIEEPEPPPEPETILSQVFTTEANILPYKFQEWQRAIENMVRQGVDPTTLRETISVMREKKLTVTGPWSVEGMAISRKVAGKSNGVDLGIVNR